jgi:hypothetical protein
MSDWKLAQRDPSEKLAKLHFFSFTKKHAAGEIETCITVKEFVCAATSDLLFYAEADIELNQRTMPFRPSGWDCTLFGALANCLHNLRKFEYEGAEVDCAPTQN